MPSYARAVALRTAAAFAVFPEVEAVVFGGSQAGPFADDLSDADLYVYTTSPLNVDLRHVLALGFADAPEVGATFFEDGDEWTDRATGQAVDITYRSVRGIEDELERVLVRHSPRMGYSTAVVYNVLHSGALFDRAGWYAGLQEQARAPYPEALRRNVVRNNTRFLRLTPSSYRHQMELAVARQDLVSLHHRATAFLASFFDALFALNRQFHPGEKHLVAHAERLCPQRPNDLDRLVRALITASACLTDDVLTAADALAAPLETLAADLLVD